MNTVRKTVTLTDAQDIWIKSQVENGGYTNDSEYFRDLVRREQQRQSALSNLKDAIRLGYESGDSEQTVADIWSSAKTRHLNKGA